MSSAPPDRSLPPEAWGRAHRVAARLVSPLQRFLAVEAASGVVLIAAAAIALAWANSPWRDAYAWLWHQPIGVVLGDWAFVLAFSFFRLAAIAQGVAKRAQQGNASNERATEAGAMTALLAQMGAKILAG